MSWRIQDCVSSQFGNPPRFERDELTGGSVSHGWLEILEMGATDFEFFWESSRDSNIECESMYQNTRNSSWDDFTGFDLRNSMIER